MPFLNDILYIPQVFEQNSFHNNVNIWYTHVPHIIFPAVFPHDVESPASYLYILSSSRHPHKNDETRN